MAANNILMLKRREEMRGERALEFAFKVILTIFILTPVKSSLKFETHAWVGLPSYIQNWTMVIVILSLGHS